MKTTSQPVLGIPSIGPITRQQNLSFHRKPYKQNFKSEQTRSVEYSAKYLLKNFDKNCNFDKNSTELQEFNFT